MTQSFFDLEIKPSVAFEAILRDSVLRAGSHRPSWLWYLLAPFSLAVVTAFVYIPDFSISLNLIMLDTLLII